ncbi:MAG: type II toxin-antitoxin system RelE/ParE family toxin [Actinobacteria bacterium]|nr:type II toxin-antitoxin system RelE/ParE family toxin [Actinomycetota bacterium]
MVDVLSALEYEPELGHELRGRLKGLRSIRVGAYRIIYELRERGRLVRVCAIRHRGEAYKTDPR